MFLMLIQVYNNLKRYKKDEIFFNYLFKYIFYDIFFYFSNHFQKIKRVGNRGYIA